MAVVRINDELLKEVKKVINSGKNKYKFLSISGFIENAILEKLEGVKHE